MRWKIHHQQVLPVIDALDRRAGMADKANRIVSPRWLGIELSAEVNSVLCVSLRSPELTFPWTRMHQVSLMVESTGLVLPVMLLGIMRRVILVVGTIRAARCSRQSYFVFIVFLAALLPGHLLRHLLTAAAFFHLITVVCTSRISISAHIIHAGACDEMLPIASSDAIGGCGYILFR